MKDKKGFSLVELLAVIVLLGIMLLIAVPSYNKYIEKTHAAKCEADKKAIIDATKSFITDCIYKNVCATGKTLPNYVGELSTLKLKVDDVDNPVDPNDGNGLIVTEFLSPEYEKYKTLEIKIEKNDVDGVSDYVVSIDDSDFNNLCK